MRLALAGGGTGGHVVPGLHLLEHLSRAGRAPSDVLWFSAGRGVEDRALAVLPGRAGDVPVERMVLNLEPPGSGAPSWMRLLVRTTPETRRAREALRRHESDVLLALGGYTALPAVLAARTLGIPVVLLEINTVPGRATRSLAGLAERVVHAWPREGGGKGRHACFGPPLGPSFARPEPDEAGRGAAREALGLAAEAPLLVVLGGSQGAAALNRFVREHGPALVDAGVQVLHQVGPGRRAEGPEERPGLVVREYLDDVAGALDAATLVLCRGGASTLAEVAARARPALVVPYPHHPDRHQEHNARALGAGVRVVPEERLDASVVPVLARLAGPDGERERAVMSRELARCLPRDGVARLADELLNVARRFRTKA